MAEPGYPPPRNDDEVPDRVHREVRSPGEPPDEPRPPQQSYGWIWVVLLLVVVGGLAYYALSRGEPQQPQLPSFEAPEIDLPEREPAVDVDVNVESPAPATEGAPAADPQGGAEPPAPTGQPDGGGAAEPAGGGGGGSQ